MPPIAHLGYALRAVLLGAWASLCLAACFYTEEDKWKICCWLHIVKDETSSSPARRTIVGWQRETLFSGDGRAADAGVSASLGSWKGHQIESALSDFRAANPGAPASAYFKMLGMICKAPPTPLPDNVRCEIELPVTIRCSTVFLPFGGPPMPRELEGQVPAVLWTSVALPSSGDLKVSTRILPVPGGRLCQRAA
jgi:hypothetical protein